MKTLFIIDTYPLSDSSISTLNRCIDAIKRANYDVMVVSHLPIPTDICNKVNYFIYDNDNSFLPASYNPHYWIDTHQFTARIFMGGHTLPICRNLKNGVELAKSRGYDAFVFMEYDVIMSETDMETLNSYVECIDLDGKMMFFLDPKNIGVQIIRMYMKLCFLEVGLIFL